MSSEHVTEANADWTEASETAPQPIPERWIAEGTDEPLADNETRFYATRVTHESKVHGKRAGSNQTLFGESGKLHVHYVDGDGEMAVERSYRAAVVEDGTDMRVLPKSGSGADLSAFKRSIAVDVERLGVDEYGQASERDRELLRDLHGLNVGEDR